MERTLESNSETLLPPDGGVLEQVIYLLGIRGLIWELGIITLPSSLHRTVRNNKRQTASEHSSSSSEVSRV